MRRVTVEWTVAEFSLVVSVVHEGQLDCTYTAGISLLAHGFSVKLSPCSSCIVSMCGHLHVDLSCNQLLAQAHSGMMQHPLVVRSVIHATIRATFYQTALTSLSQHLGAGGDSPCPPLWANK